MRLNVKRRWRATSVGITLVIVGLCAPAATLGAVAWSVDAAAQPSEFLPTGGGQYQVVVQNIGSEVSSSGVRLTDHLAQGLTFVGAKGKEGAHGQKWACGETGTAVVSCTLAEEVGAGGYAPSLAIEVSAPGKSAGVLENMIIVDEGGATAPAVTGESSQVGTAPQAFGVSGFDMEAHTISGGHALEAGGHPWSFTTSIEFPWRVAPPNNEEEAYTPVENVKKITVELPVGLVGNMLATEHCTQAELREEACPPGSQVGAFAVAAAEIGTEFFGTGSGASAVFNMSPEAGYPAELGITYASEPVYLYASVVHSPVGERVRITTVGVPPLLGTGDIVLTLWGEPGAFNGSQKTDAFITSPSDCQGPPAKARMEAESWGQPGQVVEAETIVYQALSGCGELRSVFAPGLTLSPLLGLGGTTRADSPTGLEGIAVVPQTTAFEEKAVPEVRDASVALPSGLSVSPAAAQGLVGCPERGPEGINLGTKRVGPGGVDEGNPEATELGAGHSGGNGSPYDDGQYHTAPGHCPEASMIGSVEVLTPLLEDRCGGAGPACDGKSPAPLQGHVYIAQPGCGRTGLSVCTGADAEDGALFAGYVELSGDGVLIKERAVVAVDQATGQMTLELRELPEFPFSQLRIRTQGGQRASFATPQACGSATTTAVFTPWSASGASEAFSPVPSSFVVDADGAGGACPASWPFNPGFTGGSVSTTAAGSTSFMTTLTRQDREQNVTGLSVTPPLGLLAMLSNVTPCPEPQAAAGECPDSSLIGHDTAGAGSGSEPFYVTGRVYLTGPYKGAPFGLDVVTPAVAGPFNLGNIVVRATINVNPSTAAVTITSDPIPQSRLGVPLRLKALNVTIDKEHFVLNPTNCSQQHVTGTATGDQGATAALSTPFAVTGCAGLGFSPVLKVSTPGKASKRNGAGLSVTFTATPGQANIQKVKVDVPKQLPSRFATLQKACTDTVFNANPAGCPAASVVGSAVLHTPILKSAMTGPIYLVSHGGAAFPDLVFVLQAEGITIVLDGNTSIKHGITSETFKALPDAPFTSFTATFPQGPHSILATYLPAKAKYSLCGQKLNMPTSITGQNNAVITKTTKLTVTGCSKPKPKPHRPKPRK
jgi:hypothetical protein